MVRRRQTGSGNWSRGIFAAFWILLGCLSGLYLFNVFTDPTLGGHTERVARHAEAVVRRLGWSETRIEELDPRSEIIVYCHHGDKSVDGCLRLWEHGFRKVRSLTGGIEAWSELIDPSVPKY